MILFHKEKLLFLVVTFLLYVPTTNEFLKKIFSKSTCHDILICLASVFMNSVVQYGG